MQDQLTENIEPEYLNVESKQSHWLHAPFASFHRGGDVVIVTCMYGTSQFPR